MGDIPLHWLHINHTWYGKHLCFNTKCRLSYYLYTETLSLIFRVIG